QLIQVDILVTARRQRRPATTVRRRRRLVTAYRRGLPVTAPAFTVIDLGDLPTASREDAIAVAARAVQQRAVRVGQLVTELDRRRTHRHRRALELSLGIVAEGAESVLERSEEHTSELQSRFDLVCRLLLEKKKRSS